MKRRLFVILLALVFLALGMTEASSARRHQGPLDSFLQAFKQKPPAHKRKRPKPSKARDKAAEVSRTALPDKAPVPAIKPETAGDALGPDAGSAAIPIPTPNPERAAETAVEPAPEPVPPPDGPKPQSVEKSGENSAAAVPLPTPRPDPFEPEAEPEPEPEPAPPSAEPVQPAALPRPEKPFVQATAPVVTPEEEENCRKALKSLGVAFTENAPQSDPIGCRMDHPIAVSALGPAVKLSPAAVMICPMAEAAARFVQSTIAPAAQKSFGSPLVSISQASAYVCRPRHGTHKLSEHAFGNALDIASMVLADGTRIEVKADADPTRSAFLNEIRSKACGPFKTVLGPGSDADHALHFHLDLEQRRNGSTYCH